MFDLASSLSSKTRRRLLQSIGAFFLACAADSVPALESAPVPSSRERVTLAHFLDVLLPRDEFSGSATEFGVDREIWQLAAVDQRFRHLLGLGCQWLDMTGGPPFHRLDPDEQDAVVQWMSESDWNQIPRRFYELVRQLAVTIYYADPRSWTGLPLHRPPQPHGYLPPWS